MLLWRTRPICVNCHNYSAHILTLVMTWMSLYWALVYWCKKSDVSYRVLYRWRDGMGMLTTSTQQSMHLEISATDYWECTHFQDAARPRIPMHVKGKVSALRVLTRRTWLSPGEDSAMQRDLLITGTAFFLSLYTVRKKAPRWMLPGTKHTDIVREESASTEIAPPPQQTRTWHCTCREPICKCCYGRQRAGMSDPPDVQLTNYGWEVKEHEHVMPAISREPAEGKACSGRCSCGDYLAPATVSVKEEWLLLYPQTRREEDEGDTTEWSGFWWSCSGREWLIELMTVTSSRVIWHTVVTIRCLLNYCYMLVCYFVYKLWRFVHWSCKLSATDPIKHSVKYM